MFTDPAARRAHVRRVRWEVAGILACLVIGGGAFGAAAGLVHDLFIGRPA